MQARLRGGGFRFAEIILHDIREVRADIEQHAAGVFLVAPHRDEHTVATAHRDVLHYARGADGAGVAQGLGQADDWVAAIVFGHGQNAPGLLRLGDHQLAGAGGEAHRLFAYHVPTAFHRLDGDGVVMGRQSGDVDGLYRADSGQRFEVFDRMRPGAEPLLCLVGERVGVVEVGVAGADKLDGREPGVLQFGQAVAVALAHATAAAEGELFCHNRVRKYPMESGPCPSGL